MSEWIQNFSYKDTNAITKGVTGNDQIIVQGKSMVEFDITLNPNLDVDHMEILVDGYANESLSGNITAYLYGAIFSKDDVSAILRVIDTDGIIYCSPALHITVVPYAKPAIDASAERINNFESETELKATAMIASVAGKNKASITYRTKKTTASAFGAYKAITSGETAIVTLDNRYAYDIEFTLTDSLGEMATVATSIGKGIPFVFYDTELKSMAMNGFPTHENAFECDALYLAGSAIHPNSEIHTSASVAASSYGSEGKIASLNIPKGKYLILGTVYASIGDDSVQLADFKTGTNCTKLIGQPARGTMTGGGGTNAWAIIEASADSSVDLYSYNFCNSSYTWNGNICAIRLE